MHARLAFSLLVGIDGQDAHASVRFPADFMLVAAMNPTPKGTMPDTEGGRREMTRYLARISGPLIDRIDIHVEVLPVPFRDLTRSREGMGSREMRCMAAAARARQFARQGGGGGWRSGDSDGGASGAGGSRAGDSGGALNARLQAALNPPGPKRIERQVGGRVFRTGDRLMQIRNNYDKDVFNGDMGYITDIDLEDQMITVNMDGRPVRYDFLELDELIHAYAISVHKAQGSEFPAVVVPLLTTHYLMLQRNLLYTAVTRAQRLVVLVGSPRAIGIAVKTDRAKERFSGLAERLGQASDRRS